MRLPSTTPWSGDAGRTRVKICCIASEDEATIALNAGADLLGLVSWMPSGPGPIAETRISEIVRFVDRRAATVLLTSRQDGEGIGAQLGRMSPAVLQLVDEVGFDVYAELRDRYPAVVLMQVLHVRSVGSMHEAVRIAPHVDAILLDSGNPGAAVKELGGTGRVHDWKVSRAVREAVDIPVLLAGGLSAANVAEAIGVVGPFGVDVCSGVRTRGALDAVKVQQFIAAAGGRG